MFLLLLLLSSGVWAQNATQCLSIAKDLYSIGEYEEAIRFYRRVLYFDENLAVDSYFNIGETYLSTKQFEKARYYFSLAEQKETSDSVKNEIRFRTVTSYILENNVMFAKAELLGIDDANSEYFKRKKTFYLGVVAFKRQDIDEAERYFKTLFSNSQIAELEALIKEGRKINNKKPYLAMAMSVVLPGAGQAYAGEWGDAANSFFLNLVTTTLYVYVWYEYSFIDAVIAVLPWWHRYYVGGFTNAHDMIEDKRSEKLDAILNDVLLLYALTLDE